MSFKSHSMLLTGIAALLVSACGGIGVSAEGSSPPLVASDPKSACEGLVTSAKLDGHTLDAATYVAEGFKPPGLTTMVSQPFCRLQLTSKPSMDSDIKSELWMPRLSGLEQPLSGGRWRRKLWFYSVFRDDGWAGQRICYLVNRQWACRHQQ